MRAYFLETGIIHAPSLLIWFCIVLSAWEVAISRSVLFPVRFAETNRTSRFIMLSIMT